MTVVLDWRGPFQFPSFFTNDDLKREFSTPGVYLWIEDTPAGRHLSYVGKAGGSPPLFVRQCQHYASMIGGLYTIPQAYRTTNQAWVPDWSKHDVVQTLLDPTLFHKIVDDGFAYSKHCTIYLSILESDAQTKLVERQLLYDLQPTGTKWGRLTPPHTPLTIAHRNANWASESIVAQAGRPILLV